MNDVRADQNLADVARIPAPCHCLYMIYLILIPLDTDVGDVTVRQVRINLCLVQLVTPMVYRLVFGMFSSNGQSCHFASRQLKSKVDILTYFKLQPEHKMLKPLMATIKIRHALIYDRDRARSACSASAGS